MKEIDIETWNRKTTYEWFNSFTDSTYSVTVKMDITKLVKITKETNSSFFANMLYVVVNGLNSIPEMRMRMYNGKPVIFDDINPAITVMTKDGIFTNARFWNNKDYKSFYKSCRECVDCAYNNEYKSEYNPENTYNEYYITCLPWLNFESVTHPMPNDKHSQCVPRVAWGKYYKVDDKYWISLNISVSHIFVDGYPLSCCFNKIQELLDNIDRVLK